MNAPKLRFKEFNGEWKQDTLLNLSIEISYGMNCAAKEYDGINKYIRITDIDEITSKYKNDNIVSPSGDLDNKFIVKENDILFARTGASTGKTYLYNTNDGKMYYAGFLIKASIKNHNANFIFQQTKLNRYNKWLKIMSQRSGQPGINSQEYGDYKFYVCSKDEEDKIAYFLSLLDKKIELQSKKIEDLKLYKKYNRKNLLSAISAKKKIIDLLNYEQPSNYIVNSDDYSDNKTLIPVLTANKAFILGYCNENNYYNKGDCIIFDDFTMDSKYVTFNFKIKSSAIKILTPKEDVNLKYIFECIQELKLESVEHKRHYISIVQEIMVPVPSFASQNKIANLLTEFDKKIELENNKLNKLQELKKGLMQNMFV